MTIFILCESCKQPKRKRYRTNTEARVYNPKVPKKLFFYVDWSEVQFREPLPPVGFKDWCSGHENLDNK